MTHLRGGAWLLLGLLLCGTGCGDTTLGVDVVLESSVSPPQTLLVSLYSLERAIVRDRRISVGTLPGRVLINLPDETQALRVVFASGEAPVRLGGTAVKARAHSFSLAGLLLSTEVHDRDQDGVPDGLDNCPDTANPDQLSAHGAIGDACGGAAGDLGGAGDAGTGVPTVIAVGEGGRRVRSLDGLSWDHFAEVNPNGGNDDDQLWGVGFGGGVAVAVGGSVNGYSLTTTDGITWSHENRQARAWMGNVAWLDGVFVAAGGNGLRTRSLDLGVSWIDDAGFQKAQYPDIAARQGIAAGLGLAVAVGTTYGGNPDVGLITTTSDGRSWTERRHQGASLLEVEFGNGRFVTMSETGSLLYSSDGIAWTPVSIGATKGIALSFAGGAFYVTTDLGVHSSADGVSWAPRAGLRSIDGFFAGRYLSFDGLDALAASLDLAAWQSVYALPPGTAILRRMAAGSLTR